MKRNIIMVLCLALLFTLVTQHKVNAETQEVVLLEKQKEIYANGKIVGKSYSTITRTMKGSKITLNKKIKNHYNNGSITEETEVTTIEIINENVAEINGVEVDMNKVLYVVPNKQVKNNNQWEPLNSGGLYSYITYEDRFYNYSADPYKTYMQTASGIKNRLTSKSAMFLESGGAADGAIWRAEYTNGPSALDIRDFKRYAADVENAKETIDQNSVLLAAGLGVAVLTIASVVGAIASATLTIATFGTAIWDAGSDANDAMASAYTILSNM